MTAQEALRFPRVLIPLAGLAGTVLAVPLAVRSHAGFPSFASWACEGNGASGCLEWSGLIYGPFYAIGYILFVAFLAAMALAPLAISFLVWLWPLTKRPAAGSEPKSSRITVWEGFKDIIRGKEPNA